jgi:hypothetical protein
MVRDAWKGMEMGRKMEGVGREMGVGNEIEIELGSEIQKVWRWRSAGR